MSDSPTTRVALVTGAARGIGRGIALRLSADGLDVAVADLPAMGAEAAEVAEEIRATTGRRAVALEADVREAEAVDALVESTVAELGGLDVMVANAGVVDVAPLLEVAPEAFDRLMDVNLRGVFLSYVAAARQMIAQGRGGRIIGAASIAGYRGAPNLAPYAASKFAVRGLTQGAAQEWAEHGITVNAYCPGIVDTAMWAKIDDELGVKRGLAPREALEGMTERIPLGRLQTPDDVASLVSFLASEDAGYITGQSIIVDGGMQFG